MNAKPSLSSVCHCCTSRRRFLATCGGFCAASAGSLGDLARAASETTSAKNSAAQSKRPRVRLIFACFTVKQQRPTWPHIGYDFTADIERVTKALGRLCPQVEFLPAVAHGPEDAGKLLAGAETDRIDGYLVYQMNNWVQVMQAIVVSGKPTLVADFLFAGSGGFLGFTAALRRAHKNFSVVASSRIEDLAESARCFELLKQGSTAAEFAAACDQVRRQRTPAASSAPVVDDPIQVAGVGECLQAMKRARLVTVGGSMQNLAHEIRERVGIEVVPIDFKELAAAYDKTDCDKAVELARHWKSTARAVTLDDADATLEKSARIYLAQQAVMANRRRRGDHDQLPGRFLWRTSRGVPLPGLRGTAQRGPGGGLRGRSAVQRHADRDEAPRRPAGIYFGPGARHVQAADHLLPLRRFDEDVRPGGAVQSVRDPHAFRKTAGGPRCDRSFRWAT